MLEHGLDGAGEALRILVHEASKIERAALLNARPHQRTAERTDYANGFKPKTVMTRVGEMTFDIPQLRCGGFYPSALEREPTPAWRVNREHDKSDINIDRWEPRQIAISGHLTWTMLLS